MIGLSLFNICLGVAIQAGVEMLFTEVLNIRSALKVTTALPMPWGLAKDVVRGLLLREVIPPFLIHRDKTDQRPGLWLLHSSLYLTPEFTKFPQQTAQLIFPCRHRTLLIRSSLRPSSFIPSLPIFARLFAEHPVPDSPPDLPINSIYRHS